MSDDNGANLRRRQFLKGAAAAGAGSLAGCSTREVPNLLGSNAESAQRDPAPMVKNAPRGKGPLASRPERGETEGFEYLVDRGPKEGALYVWQDGEWKLLDVHTEPGTVRQLSSVQFASAHATAGRGTADDPWVVDDAIVNAPGLVFLDEGEFVSEGLRTTADIDYEETSIWLTGVGTRTTSLTKDPSSDRHLIEFDNDGDSGNFGGVRNMGVYGEFPHDGTRSKGHLIYSSGDIFDLTFENLIVRYGWEDGVHIAPSASGTRMHNCWVENNGGWAVWIDGGTRAKLSDLHIINSKDGGLHFEPSQSHVTGLSVFHCWPGVEIDCSGTEVSDCWIGRSYITEEGEGGVALHELSGAGNNRFANLAVVEADVGILAEGRNSQYANVGVRDTQQQAVRVASDGVSVTGLRITDFGKRGQNVPALDVQADDCQVNTLAVAQRSKEYAGEVVARVEGRGNVLSNVKAEGNRPWRIRVSGKENVLQNVHGVARSNVVDDGVRTIVNGEGTNRGNPNSTGEWAGHGDYARDTGATVWDTTTAPWTPYKADGQGNWREL
ncbi:right-handed parallel beta-helix repeat-containing protein [Halegenticoccus soli]|uniref:right-handed parallel beta-helix repeat-containing protein n=1 Tax=Halegenticoccus soli TaxID=1985678 RepID=UPI000C6EC5F5|nr:right-handed parallel beta-helix repeat-containing protein [Halegenticoccus soli]